MLQPIERRSLADAVYRQILRRIVNRELDPGTELPGERELSETFKVNRNALREALKRLQQAGLLHVRHGGRSRVSNYLREAGLSLLADMLFTDDGLLDPKVARSVVEMRLALGPDLARRAAQRMTSQQRTELEQVQDSFRSANVRRDRQTAALAMWDVLAEASDNVAYRLAFNTLRNLYLKLFDVLSEVLAAEVDDVSAHFELMQSVLQGDADGAESKARRLLNLGSESMLDALGQLNALTGEQP